MKTSLAAIQVADWRVQVFGLYSTVREVSATDPEAAHRIWRKGRDSLFATHPASPLLTDDHAAFEGLLVADYDASWRFECEIVAPTAARVMRVETGTDGVVPFELLGSISVPDVGDLDVWRLTTYGGGLFLPVKDALSGHDGGTYGGGRYVLDTVKGAHLGSVGESGLMIDFNFAYNPSCAYDPAWACPLAQAGNTVSVPIPVGEFYHAAGR